MLSSLLKIPLFISIIQKVFPHPMLGSKFYLKFVFIGHGNKTKISFILGLERWLCASAFILTSPFPWVQAVRGCGRGLAVELCKEYI